MENAKMLNLSFSRLNRTVLTLAAIAGGTVGCSLMADSEPIPAEMVGSETKNSLEPAEFRNGGFMLPGVSTRANGFFVGPRVALNIQVEFVDTFQTFTNLGTLGGATDNRVYQDGFVGVDVTGNALNLTSYFGYDDLASQASGGFLNLSAVGSANGGFDKIDDEPAYGLELGYRRDLSQSNYFDLGWEFSLGVDFLILTRATPSTGAQQSSLINTKSIRPCF